jgi:hypothetical protein
MMTKKEKLDELSNIYNKVLAQHNYHCYHNSININNLDVVKNIQGVKTACYASFKYDSNVNILSLLYDNNACVFNKSIIKDYIKTLNAISITLGFNEENFKLVSDDKTINFENYLFYPYKDGKNLNKKSLYLLVMFRYCWENEYRYVYCIYMILYYLTKLKKYNEINDYAYIMYFATMFEKTQCSTGGHSLHNSNVYYIKIIPNTVSETFQTLESLNPIGINECGIKKTNVFNIDVKRFNKNLLTEYIITKDYKGILKMYISFMKELNKIK